MIRTIVQHRAKIDCRVTCQYALADNFVETLFDGRDKVTRHRTAKDLIDELKARAARQWLETNPDVAKLTAPAGLLLMTSLHLRLLADRLAVWDLGRMRGEF